MEVLLIEDVVNVGRTGEIHKVSPGYARNYLIPRGLAVPATKGARKQTDQIKRQAEKRRAREVATAQALSARIEGSPLRFEVKVGETGRLYGSVTSADIAERLSETLGLEIDKRKVELHEPIKTLGTYSVPVRLAAEVVPLVPVEVVGEHGETAADFLPPAETPTPTAEEVVEAEEEEEEEA
ncbi:MAG: 50S ribosomal protein L9 [Ardenticatenaceae bacterium]|nr:50S ribosomal protein L9 [Ardenticatenaceae bacterium]HBY99226.1 50S ribosomal protein L9 [Chloroflexota bacterium]